jgi:hypothetical protein
LNVNVLVYALAKVTSPFKLIVPEKVGLALGAYVDEALNVVKYVDEALDVFKYVEAALDIVK